MINDKILIRYIIGKASREECSQVAQWVMESHDNAERFAKLKAEYVFANLPNKILEPERKRRTTYFVRAFAALSIPLFIFCVYLSVDRSVVKQKYAAAEQKVEMYESQTEGSTTYIANPGTKSSITLADNTVVMLNSHSKLVVPNRFGIDSRDVYLEGEGYFQVFHNENCPMNIRTSKGVKVRVLGTTFNLSSYSDDEELRLTLIEGRVTVKREGYNAEHIIRPDQEIIVKECRQGDDITTANPVIQPANIDKALAWTKGQLFFDNTSISQVFKSLERWYGVDIHVADASITDYRLTATFSSESITRVMELIKFSTLIDYTINGNQVYVRKNAVL